MEPSTDIKWADQELRELKLFRRQLSATVSELYGEIAARNFKGATLVIHRGEAHGSQVSLPEKGHKALP